VTRVVYRFNKTAFEVIQYIFQCPIYAYF